MYSCHIMAWCVKWLCSVVRSWPHRSPEFDEEASGSSCWTCWTRAANWNSVWAGRSDGEGRTLCWWRDNPQNSGTTRQVEWSKGDCNFLVNILRIYVIEAHASPLVCALCWVVWRNFHSQQHTYMSSSYRSSRLALSQWDPYAVHRGGCLEFYYCNMLEGCSWDSSLIWKTNWFPSVFWDCWFGHMTCKNRPWKDLCVEWDVKPLHYYYYYCCHSCLWFAC